MQDLRDMVKARQLEAQTPAMKTAHPRKTMSNSRAKARRSRYVIGAPHPLSHWQDTMSVQNGSNGTPTSRDCPLTLNHGMAYGTRVLRLRSPYSSPRWGKPITWRRGTEGGTTQDREVAKCKQPKPI
jgi:hypothetical protein